MTEKKEQFRDEKFCVNISRMQKFLVVHTLLFSMHMHIK